MHGTSLLSTPGKFGPVFITLGKKKWWRRTLLLRIIWLYWRCQKAVTILPLTTSKVIKFIYSEKATKFCEISTFRLSYVVPVKSKVQSEFKIKNVGLNQVYGEDLWSLFKKTKNWCNNVVSRRFGKYSFQLLIDNWHFHLIEILTLKAENLLSSQFDCTIGQPPIRFCGPAISRKLT